MPQLHLQLPEGDNDYDDGDVADDADDADDDDDDDDDRCRRANQGVVANMFKPSILCFSFSGLQPSTFWRTIARLRQNRFHSFPAPAKTRVEAAHIAFLSEQEENQNLELRLC